MGQLEQSDQTTSDPGERGSGAAFSDTPGRADGLGILSGVAIRHLFGLTLEMSGLLELNQDREVDRRIRRLISNIDDLIGQFRRVDSDVSAAHVSADVDPVDDQPVKNMPYPSPDGGRAVSLLREASVAIDSSLGFVRHQEQAPSVLVEVELAEASWAVHRALIALTA